MDDIFNQIMELETDDQIWSFIIDKTILLELYSEEKTVGQGYTDSFRDYISNKIHFKPSSRFENGECPDLIYDYNEPYFNLIKLIRQNNSCDIRTLLMLIHVVIYEYFEPYSIDSERAYAMTKYNTYLSNIDSRLSIGTIRRIGIAACSEKSGLAQNMLKLLGIDSEFVCGALNDGYHAYNLVFPNGYDNEPVILNDSRNFFYYTFKDNEYEQFISGKPLTVGENNDLTYIFGLENAKTYLESKEQQHI